MTENGRANPEKTTVVLDYGSRGEAILLLVAVLVVGTLGYMAFFG